MALKKGEKRLLKILGLVVIVVVIYEFIGSSGHNKSQAGKGAPKSSPLTAPFTKSKLAGAAGVKSPESQKIHYDTWGKDPFYTSGGSSSGGSSVSSGKGKKLPPPLLKGIFWNQGRACVLIDSVILREGEEKKGLTVEKIKGTEVLCRRGKHLFTLHWRESP